MELVVGGNLIVALDLLRQTIHRVQQRLPPLSAFRRQRLEGADILHLEIGRVRIAGLERFVASTQEGAFAQFPGERRIARDGHVRRQFAREAHLVGDHGAHRRIVAERRTESAAQHPVGGRLVMVVVVSAGAHQREAIHHLGHARQHLADAQAGHARINGLVIAANFSRRVRFGIERIVVGETAAEINEQDGLRSRSTFRARLCLALQQTRQ